MKSQNNKDDITMLCVFHDHETSGGSLALLDLIETWKSYSNISMNIICVLPKRKGSVVEKLKDLNVQILSYPYWKAVIKGNEKIITKLKCILEFVFSYISTYIFTYVKLRKENINVVYSNTSSIFEGAWISKILKKPHIWHIRERLSHEHYVVPILGNEKHYNYVVNNADILIFISNYLKEYYDEYCGSAKRYMIYDDISPSYDMMNVIEHNYDCDLLNILVAGNITEGKGQHIVVEAMNILKQQGIVPHLYFAGAIDVASEDYYNQLIGKINEYHLNDNVHFLGKVQDMNALREKMQIGIISSKQEAFGRVTIENMLANMIVIGADDASTRELISHGTTGYLYDVNSYQELANSLSNIIQMDSNQKRKIAENGYTYAKRFIEGNCAKKLLEIICEVKY